MAESGPPMMSHGGQVHSIARAYGLCADSILDFSANINPDGPPACVGAAICSALDDPRSLTQYPDLALAAIKEAFAVYAGVPDGCVSVANGFAPLLAAALQSRGIERCLLPVPCFGEYRRTLENLGIAVHPLVLDASGFLYALPTLESAVSRMNRSRDGSRGAVMLANPQNPSGVLHTFAEIEVLLAAIHAQGSHALLDEAFIDYEPGISLSVRASTEDALCVFRSITKFFACPGLRIAYAINSQAVTRRLDSLLAPWPLTTLAAIGADAAVRDLDFAEGARLRNTVRRKELLSQLAHLPMTVVSSGANFLLLALKHPDVDAIWRHLLTEEHILTRACGNFEGLPPGHLRVCVRTEEDNLRLTRGLDRALCSKNVATR